MPSLVHPIQIRKYKNNLHEEKQDLVAVEEPLEIRLGFGPEEERQQKSLAITMRTPGHDLELVIGFLSTEGIIQRQDEITYINHCKDHRGEESENVVRVELKPEKSLNWQDLQRHFYTNSSCGICGKASIETLEKLCPVPVSATVTVFADVLHNLPDKMRQAQNVFEYTGGLHAAALFTATGELLLMREDIGRHNALDKIIGAALSSNLVPLHSHIVVLSGRSCFELVQKAVMAGVPVVSAVGAPSSLAVKTAEKLGVTLLGFSRNNGFNVYSNAYRINENQNTK
ncbi:MAG: formate dehydrogenase accessory sulfurtransferase FdhD [Bacteroidia bacterium]